MFWTMKRNNSLQSRLLLLPKLKPLTSRSLFKTSLQVRSTHKNNFLRIVTNRCLPSRSFQLLPSTANRTISSQALQSSLVKTKQVFTNKPSLQRKRSKTSKWVISHLNQWEDPTTTSRTIVNFGGLLLICRTESRRPSRRVWTSSKNLRPSKSITRDTI